MIENRSYSMRTAVPMMCLFIASTPAVAQGMPPDPPTPHECRTAANKLNSDPRSAAHRWALTEGRLAECGAAGAAALAQELSRVDAAADTVALRAYFFAASANRSREIVDAALGVAANRAAGPRARALSLHLLVRQHNIQVAIPWNGVEALTRVRGKPCMPELVLHAEYKSLHELPTDYQTRIIRVLDQIAADATEAAFLRELSRCTVEIIRHIRPWQSDGDDLWVEEPVGT